MSNSMILVIFLVLMAAEAHPPQMIRGGEDAAFEDHPYMAFLKDIKSRNSCAGILISEKHVLTAAHCVTQATTPMKLKPTSSLRIFIGHDDLRHFDGWYRRRVQKIYVHDDWKGISRNGTDADIAIVEIEVPFVLNWDIKTASLTNNPIEAQTEGIIIGWGSSSNGGGLRKKMQRAQTVTITLDSCRFIYKYRLSNRTFCTLGRDLDVSFCHGDSGGPFINRAGRVAGIISYTRGCSGLHPNIFTDVFSFKSWIERVLRGEIDDNCMRCY